MSTAAALSRGSFRLPHLGDWMQEGQPDSHGHRSMVRSVAPIQSLSTAYPFSVIPTPPGWPSWMKITGRPKSG